MYVCSPREPDESVQARLMGAGTLRGDAKERREPFLIKADNHFVSDKYDRHTHLTGFLYHFLTLFQIARNIVFRIADTLFLEKILRHMTEVTGRRAVDGNGFVHI